MKFKIIASVAVIIVMILATMAYIATKNAPAVDENGNPIPQEQLQPAE